MSRTEHRFPPLLIEDQDALGPPRAVWTVLLAIVIAQVSLVAVVFAIDFSVMGLIYFFLATWLWVLGAIVFLAGPAAVAFRLRKVRSRRAFLYRAEWMIEDAAAQGDPAPRSR